jgi:hypothetical protein
MKVSGRAVQGQPPADLPGHGLSIALVCSPAEFPEILSSGMAAKKVIEDGRHGIKHPRARHDNIRPWAHSLGIPGDHHDNYRYHQRCQGKLLRRAHQLPAAAPHQVKALTETAFVLRGSQAPVADRIPRLPACTAIRWLRLSVAQPAEKRDLHAGSRRPTQVRVPRGTFGSLARDFISAGFPGFV